MASITCRNYIATDAKFTTLAAHHCTLLHAGKLLSGIQGAHEQYPSRARMQSSAAAQKVEETVDTTLDASAIFRFWLVLPL